MTDTYKELSTSGWAVVSKKGRVFGSESENESGEQSDYVALETDVVHYHHISSSKDREDEAATKEETEDSVLGTESMNREDEAATKEETVDSVLGTESAQDHSMKVDGASFSGRCSPEGDNMLDQVLMVPNLERGMSISDVIEDNVRIRLNIGRTRSSASTSSACGFLLDEAVNISRDSRDLGAEGLDTSGSDVEMEGDVIEGRVQDVILSKDVDKEERVDDSDSDFEHLSQEDISGNEGLLERAKKPDSPIVDIKKEEGLNKLDARPQTSEAITTCRPSLFQTTSDDSDSSKLFHPGRGIRKRFTTRRSRNSSTSNAAITEEAAQRKSSANITKCKKIVGGKFPYILLIIFALSTGYYIGSSQLINYKQQVEQGKTQRLHALQDELLSCLSSEEINNEQVNMQNIQCPDNAIKIKPIEFSESNMSEDVSNVKQSIIGDNGMDVKNDINKDTAFEEDEFGVEDGIKENISLKETDGGESSRDEGNEIKSVGGEDWMDNKLNFMENDKSDKISDYETRISKLEAHYKEMHELYKQKMLKPEELNEKMIALESQLTLATEALKSRPKFEPPKNDDVIDTSSDPPIGTSDESNWISIPSFASFKKKIEEAVQKTDHNVIWSYYDKTKESAIGLANKARQMYDYTKSDEFASNIVNTQQKLQDTLTNVNDAVSSQWQSVKKSSEDMSAYVRETSKNAKITLAKQSEQVKKSISTLDLGKKLEELKNFTTSADIMNKTKSTLRDLSEKVVQMKKYTQSDEFKSSMAKTKETILESLDEAVQNTKESVSGFGNTLGDTWSTMKLSIKDIRSKATENWETVKEKTGLGKKKKHDNRKREHNTAHIRKKHHKSDHMKVNDMKNKHHNKQKESQPDDIENIDELLTGNWRQLYAKHFTMICKGDQVCIKEQRDDAETLMQELIKYNEWLQKNNYKKDAKKIKRFVNELWPLVNGEEVHDQMLENLKGSLGDILKSMHQRAQRHRKQYVKSPDISADNIARKDGRKFSGRGFHSDDDWYSKRAIRRVKDQGKGEEANNYDWFTLRGMDRERARQGSSPIEGDWFLRRGKDRDSQRNPEGESADPNWYFKWTQSRSDMRTGMSMWDLYNWFHDWHDHRY